MTGTLAAVDLGAQSGRVAVGRFDGRQLTVEEVHRFPNVPVTNGGRLEWDFDRLLAEVEAGLRLAGPVDSIAVDSWAVDFGLVDDAGRLQRNPAHYRDARRAAAFDAVLEQIPARELYERTAVQLLPINTIFELAAMADEPDPAPPPADPRPLPPAPVRQRVDGAHERVDDAVLRSAHGRLGARPARTPRRADRDPP